MLVALTQRANQIRVNFNHANTYTTVYCSQLDRVKHEVFFQEKTLVVNRKKWQALALLYLASGQMLQTQTMHRPSSKKNRNFNFSPSTKKTTGYSLELFSLYR